MALSICGEGEIVALIEMVGVVVPMEASLLRSLLPLAFAWSARSRELSEDRVSWICTWVVSV